MSLIPPTIQKSTFKGVEYIVSSCKYRAYVYTRRGEKRIIGLFDDEIEAAKFRDQHVIRNGKSVNKNLNFPAPNFQI